MMNNFIVYIHYRADTKEPFYVGEGRPARCKEFRRRNSYWTNVYKKHGCIVKVIKTNMSKKEATRLETKIIKGLKKSGYKLTNIIDSNISEYSKKRGNPKLAQWNKEHSGVNSPTYGLKRPDLVNRNKTATFKRFMKKVQCIETGLIFKSCRAACDSFNKPKSVSLINHLKGRQKTAFGYTWRYVTC